MGYWRDIDGVPPQARVNRTAHDGAGRATAQWDPRLFLDASAPPNLQTDYALSGAVLSTSSVDAGWRVALSGEAGQPLHHWDGRGSQRWLRYDTQLRPESVFEQAVDGEAFCMERLSYGASDPVAAEHNQCGQLIRHDDPAGTQRFTEFGLHGAVLEQTRHFLQALTLPDWPEPEAERELLLEPGEGAITRLRFNALGETIYQTDAKGHRQLFSQTLDGQWRAVRLQLNGASTPKTLVSDITYNAHGQTKREVAGNGVITTLEYDAQNGRLTRLLAQRGNETLQDLRYAYDPVGNVLSIEDGALPIRYFANQRIEPVNRYGYDTLSQLIEATGWEAGSANKGPQFSTFDDPAPRANYRQTYRYDTGSNLLELTHEGPQSHGHRLVAAAHSNRCLPVLEGVEPDEEDFRRGFDGNGNLLNLQPGQALAWDLHNQLGEVRPVERDSGLSDRERYVYGADGMRLRKVREAHTNARTLIAETRYLPNLELRNDSGTGEVLQVISVQTGRSSVRVLHWQSAPPKDSANDQYRYYLNDHLGSCTLELDDDGEVISQERYHPFGTTAWFAGRGEVEASYRTVRYSGKERDATGLYYYGFRYYVAGWQRWLNPDPAGTQDGLNIFTFVNGNPVSFKDLQGLNGIDILNITPRQKEILGLNGPQLSPAQAMYEMGISWKSNGPPSAPVAYVESIDQRIWNNLVLADVANRFSKALLPFGSRNQKADLWRTRGHAYAQINLARPTGELSLPHALHAGSGNCGEFSMLNFSLLASTSRNDPIFRVAAEGEDHAFVVIGDSRIRSEVVFADAWPTFPQAHLAFHGSYRVGDVLESLGPGPALPDYVVDDRLLERASQISFPLEFGDKKQLGKLLKYVREDDLAHTEWFSLKDHVVGIDYKAQSKGVFSTLSESFVKERLGHYQQYLKAGGK
ncbi:RHS repeat-associated core domain-containing protein [Pseudomonas sp. BF-R-19]|uniref:RHS repeat-associated core domain-containing protein n=1 Tax=Pseudomonas sp. BF-R-19 TaxID=2832397 RepID=UPI001CBE8BE9|nr:RHS repeat-associated core domain-containing protein [Pseudomonas sp. BF-R-19]